jgi:hypothetical protein
MTSDSDVRIECWCRSLAEAPDGPQAEVVERLEWLAAGGVLDDVAVETWPRLVPADEEWALGGHERRVHERLAAFEAWAARTGVELRGGFDERDVGNEFTDPSVERVRVLPVVALAEYHDGQLTMVSPMCEGGGVFRVQDHLQALSRGRASTRTTPVVADD